MFNAKEVLSCLSFAKNFEILGLLLFEPEILTCLL